VLGVVALIGHSGTRRDIGTDVERGGQLCAIADLAASQMEGDWQAIEIGFEVDFAGKSAARTPERLIFLPSFGPGHGDVRANHGAVEHLDQVRCLAGLGQELEERLDDAGSAEPPEALPDAVPRTERRGKRAPGQIMDREKMQCLQKLAVVPPRLAAARLSSSETIHTIVQSSSIIPVTQPAILVTGLLRIRDLPIRESPIWTSAYSPTGPRTTGETKTLPSPLTDRPPGSPLIQCPLDFQVPLPRKTLIAFR
jgi:hypothetical protein